MLHARCLRSEVPHARIKKLDVRPALAVPGVCAVITSEDYFEHGLYGFPVKDKYMLAYQKVRLRRRSDRRGRRGDARGGAEGHRGDHLRAGAAARPVRPGAQPRARRAAGRPGPARRQASQLPGQADRPQRRLPGRMGGLPGPAGRALFGRAAGARVHRARGRAGHPDARGRGDRLRAEPEPLRQPVEPVAGARPAVQPGPHHPAARRRFLRRQGRPDLRDVGPGRQAGAEDRAPGAHDLQPRGEPDRELQARPHADEDLAGRGHRRHAARVQVRRAAGLRRVRVRELLHGLACQHPRHGRVPLRRPATSTSPASTPTTATTARSAASATRRCARPSSRPSTRWRRPWAWTRWTSG